MLASIIIRTYNEQKYLEALLAKIQQQKSDRINYEVIIVDSGSNDDTLKIAANFDCTIIHLKKEEFTFGLSLNKGCSHAKGDFLVFISGHCIPSDNSWLDNLCAPLIDDQISYIYGRQEGKYTTKFSEQMHFQKWFPNYAKIPQDDFFCNNANAALKKDVWQHTPFDESLTGLEDMCLAKRIKEQGLKIGYTPYACVFHIHDESWKQVKIRYEREAFALQKIMPDMHFSFLDFLRYFSSSVLLDWNEARQRKQFLRLCYEIVLFRFFQNWGTMKGSKDSLTLSKHRKNRYFYPKDLDKSRYHDQ